MAMEAMAQSVGEALHAISQALDDDTSPEEGRQARDLGLADMYLTEAFVHRQKLPSASDVEGAEILIYDALMELRAGVRHLQVARRRLEAWEHVRADLEKG